MISLKFFSQFNDSLAPSLLPLRKGAHSLTDDLQHHFIGSSRDGSQTVVPGKKNVKETPKIF